MPAPASTATSTSASTSSARAKLQFWYRITTHESSTTVASDKLTVDLVNPKTGAKLATLATLSNLDRTNGWTKSLQYDLTPYQGQTVRLRFTAELNGTNITSFWLDDISVFLATAATATFNPPSVDRVNGWWWNPAEGGRGFAVERQGNQLFVAAFLYEIDGSATWYVATMTQDAGASTNTYSGPFTRYAGGQSLLGSYRAPTSTKQVGSGAITFSADYRSATLAIDTYDGRGPTMLLQRFPISSPAFLASGGDFQNGWWWNESQGGRGFFIEAQNNTAFVGAFMYDDAGQPTWYVSTANVTSATVGGTLQRYRGGQALSGTYQAPNTNGTAGQMSLAFHTATSATMTLPDGSTIPLRRYAFNSAPTTGTTKVTLQSDPDDLIGRGQNFMYTKKNTSLTVTANANYFSIAANGDDEHMVATLEMPVGSAMVSGQTYTGLRNGLYGNTPVNFAVKIHRHSSVYYPYFCSKNSSSTVSVPTVEYRDGNVVSLILEFEQRCDESPKGALRGRIEWYANDPTLPDGPIAPPPAGLWTPASDQLPANGNYVYLKSEPGDPVGAGKTIVATGSDFQVGEAYGTISVFRPALSATPNLPDFLGVFWGLASGARPTRGFYGGLTAFAGSYNAAKGTATWMHGGNSCGSSSGWLVIDDIAYTGGTISRLKLRFEQRCSDASAPMRGAVNWTR